MRLVLGIIPARGGSKSIPGKNIRSLAGQPLLAYAVNAARGSGILDRVILTTDSPQIAAVGRDLQVEVPFMRPPELAEDATPMLPVLQHAVRFLEGAGWSPEVIVLLQPTAPLRQTGHIRDAVRLLAESGADSVASVVEVPRHYAPHYVMKIEEGRLVNFLPDGAGYMRRQDVPPAYSRDGTVYVTRRDVLMERNSIYGADCRPLVLRDEDSLNLDTMDDWAAAEQRIRTLKDARA